jgi:polyisoprenoid-binding protein YceI
MTIFVQIKFNNMKKVVLSIFVLAGLSMMSCTKENVNYTVDKEATTLEWAGHYMAGGEVHHSHAGTVTVSEGTIVMNDGKFVEGKFVIDMSTLAEPEASSPEKAMKFIGHMNSEDYFNVEKFPTTTFTIQSIDENGLVGVLNVVGVDLNVTIPAKPVFSENGMTASAEYTLDFGSLNIPGLGIDPENPEEFVSSSVDFKLNLVMTK